MICDVLSNKVCKMILWSRVARVRGTEYKQCVLSVLALGTFAIPCIYLIGPRQLNVFQCMSMIRCWWQYRTFSKQCMALELRLSTKFGRVTLLSGLNFWSYELSAGSRIYIRGQKIELMDVLGTWNSIAVSSWRWELQRGYVSNGRVMKVGLKKKEQHWGNLYNLWMSVGTKRSLVVTWLVLYCNLLQFLFMGSWQGDP